MAGHITIGILLIASAVMLTYALVRFEFIRNNPILLLSAILNPFLVGFFAGSAFLVKSAAPTLANPLFFVAVGLILLSLPLIVIFVPRAVLEYYAEQNNDLNKQKDQNREP